MSLYIGLMSGTSVDSIDAVLADFTAASPHLLHALNHPWPAELRATLLSLSQQDCTGIRLQQLATLNQHIALTYSDAVYALLQQAAVTAKDITAIGDAGQTICHQPQQQFPYTWQVGEPNILAERTGIPVVADFRRRDMAAGGQGAPLATAFHHAWLRSDTENRVVVNIGGIANITVLSADPQQAVIGFDTGPGNGLLDAWSKQERDVAFDQDAQWAHEGKVQLDLLQRLLSDEYFTLPAPKTTGRDYFNLTWLAPHLAAKNYAAVDVQATLVQLTIDSIVQAVNVYQPQTLLVCGGGIHNPLLMQGLAQCLSSCRVVSTTEYGIDPDWVEALCFAWLAQQRLLGKTGNLSSVTGAHRPVVLGAIYWAGEV